MKDFFNVMDVQDVLNLRDDFSRLPTETIHLTSALGRIIAEDILSDVDLPDFRRSTMDGYAIRAPSSFGASESAPAFFNVVETVRMGETPGKRVGPGEAARISTGGMVPDGADAVMMIEHTESLDEVTIEAYKTVAPGQHVIEVGEDFHQSETILAKGRRLRPQEIGLLSAFGHETVTVFRRPTVAVISTGDEVVPIGQTPNRGQIRDVNSYTLSEMVRESGGVPERYGIVKDNGDTLKDAFSRAVAASDMVLISGGSSVGARDFTIEAINALPDSEIRVHGVSISPGKPTILAKVQGKPFWGLPGHVVSAMVVFRVLVRPFIAHIAGLDPKQNPTYRIPARLSRNLSSAQGRVDYVRVALSEEDGEIWANPVLGKSGLINTMVRADGLIAVDRDYEGLEKGDLVFVMPF